MSPTIAPTAGIDISKDRLDVALHPTSKTRQFANDRSGHGNLLRWPGKRAVARVILEATGPYGRELERRLEKSALPFARVNPRHAGRFAEATDRLAKTNRVDAVMLARFGAVNVKRSSIAGRQARLRRHDPRPQVGGHRPGVDRR